MTNAEAKDKGPRKPSPTERSLAFLRESGFRARVVERWQAIPNPKPGELAGRRIDLWGCDIEAVGMNKKNTLVQTTSATNMFARERKLVQIPELRYFIRAGGDVFVHGWSLVELNGQEVSRLRLRMGRIDRAGLELVFDDLGIYAFATKKAGVRRPEPDSGEAGDA